MIDSAQAGDIIAIVGLKNVQTGHTLCDEKHPATLERGVSFFNRYGGKSVALGRYVGPVRAIIPLVAGLLGKIKEQGLL